MTYGFSSVYVGYCKALYFVKRPDQLVGDVVCKLRFRMSSKRVVMEPLRPRRNPNRIGYQAVAAGEKRTAGESRNQKRLENSEAPNMCIFVVWFLINSNPDLIKEILKHEFAIAN